jgi:probable HAF family extracellular repeat protein
MNTSAIIALAGLLASAAHGQVLYEIVDLTERAGGFADNTEARAINTNGLITGFTVTGELKEIGLAWDDDGTIQYDLPWLPKDNSTSGVSINFGGVIAGISEEIFPKDGDLYEDQKATIWQNGNAINVEDLVLFDPVMDPRSATDINDPGQIVGYAREFAGPPHKPLGFLASGGKLTDLGDLNRPEAIGSEGTIVGWRVDNEDADQAHMWFNGVLTSLHDHRNIEGDTSRAWAVSDSDVVVGDAMFEAGGVVAPAVWVGGAPSPVIDASTPGTARAINAEGVILGWIGNGEGFVRTGQSVRMLIDSIPQGLGWEKLTAYDINAAGRIVGSGVRNGETGHAFLLIPMCAADFNGDGALSILDFVALQQAFVGGDAAADINLDGQLNVLDFVAFQLLFVAGCE